MAGGHEDVSSRNAGDAAQVAWAEDERRLVEMAAHEIRSSVGSLGLLVSTLVTEWNDLDEPQRLDIAVRLRERFRHLHQVVGHFLDVEHSAIGVPQVRLQPLRVGEQLRQVESFAGRELANHEVLWFVEEDLEAQADPAALERILVNLLSNAARYSEPGTTITVSARRAGDEVEITVIDEGVGVPESEHQRIFEHLERGSSADPGDQGSGVGLSVSKAYVEAQGGRIWVESSPGSGSTFGFTLPVAPDRPAGDDEPG